MSYHFLVASSFGLRKGSGVRQLVVVVVVMVVGGNDDSVVCKWMVLVIYGIFVISYHYLLPEGSG